MLWSQAQRWLIAAGRWIVLTLALLAVQARLPSLTVAGCGSSVMRGSSAAPAPSSRRSQRGHQVESGASKEQAAARATTPIEERASAPPVDGAWLPTGFGTPSLRPTRAAPLSFGAFVAPGGARSSQIRLPTERGPPLAA